MSSKWASWKTEDAIPNKSPMVKNEIQHHEVSSSEDLASTSQRIRDVDGNRLTLNRENAVPNKDPMVQNEIKHHEVSSSEDLTSTSQCIKEDTVPNTGPMVQNESQLHEVTSSDDLRSAPQCIKDVDDSRLGASELEPKLEPSLPSIGPQCETNTSSEETASKQPCGIYGPFDMTDPFEQFRPHLQTSIMDQNISLFSLDDFPSTSTESSYSEILDKHSGSKFDKLPQNLKNKMLKCMSKGNEACFCPSTTPLDSSGNDVSALQLNLSAERENLALQNVVPLESPPQKLPSSLCLVSGTHKQGRSRLACIFPGKSSGSYDIDGGNYNEAFSDRGRSADGDIQVDGASSVSSPDSTCPDFGETTVPALPQGSPKPLPQGSLKSLHGGSLKSLHQGSLKSLPQGSLKSLPQGSPMTLPQGSPKLHSVPLTVPEDSACQYGHTQALPDVKCNTSLHTCRSESEPSVGNAMAFQENTDEQGRDEKSITSTSSHKTEGSMSSLPSLEEVAEPRVTSSASGMLSDRWNENINEHGRDARSLVSTSSKKSERSMSSLSNFEDVDEPPIPDSTTSAALDRNPAGVMSDRLNNTEEPRRDVKSLVSTSSESTLVTEGSMPSLSSLEEVAEPHVTNSAASGILSDRLNNTEQPGRDVKSLVSTSSERTLVTEGSSLPTLEDVAEPLMPDSTTLDRNAAGMLSGQWNEKTDEQARDVRSSQKTEGSMSSLPALDEIDESQPDSTSLAALGTHPGGIISRQRASSLTPVMIEDVDDNSGQFTQQGQEVAQYRDTSGDGTWTRSQQPQSVALMTHLGDDSGRLALTTTSHGSKLQNVDMTVDISNSKNVQTVGNFHYNQHVTTTNSWNIKAHSKQELANNEKLFVKTDACEEAENILESEGILFLCNLPSTGKASLGKYLLSLYQKKRFEPVILTSLAQMLAELNPRKNQAVLVTNIFGAYSFNEAMVEHFKQAFYRVDECANDTKKFIFTSSNAIFSRGLPLLKMTRSFSENQVLDLSSKSLISSTKRSLLHRHLEMNRVSHKVSENLIEKIVACESMPIFPTCCRLFARSPHLHDEESIAAVQFFQEPVHYHIHYIQCLSEGGNKIGFAALFLTMSLEGLPVCLLLDDSPVHERAKKCLSLLGHHPNPTFASIIKGAESLVGTYLVKDEEGFHFLHLYLYDAVACVLGKSHIECLMEYCSVDFLLNRVFVEEHSSVETNTRIILERKYFPFLSRRFIGEIKRGHLSLVVTHAAFSNENFFRDFVKFCKKHNEVESVLSSTDCKQPIIYWSAWPCNEYLFKWAVQEQHLQKKKMSNDLIRKTAKACCVSGNLATLESVSKVIMSFSKIVTDVRKTELPVPPYVVSGEKLLHRPTELVTMGSLLHTASFYGHLPIVKFLTGLRDSQVDLADEDGNMPVNLAAKQGHADTVGFLIEKGAKIRTNKTTVMADACEAGRTEVVKVLLESRAKKLLQMQGPEPQLMFPIHLAVLSRDPKLVKLLLGHGANPDVEDASLNTAFHAACTKKGNVSVLKVLKPTSEQLNKENKKGNRCLHLACELSEVPMVCYLLSNGSDVDALNKIQQTPLHVAAKNNHRAVVKLLLSKHANPCAVDVKGRTPLLLTKSKPISDMIKEHISKPP